MEWLQAASKAKSSPISTPVARGLRFIPIPNQGPKHCRKARNTNNVSPSSKQCTVGEGQLKEEFRNLVSHFIHIHIFQMEISLCSLFYLRPFIFNILLGKKWICLDFSFYLRAHETREIQGTSWTLFDVANIWSKYLKDGPVQFWSNFLHHWSHPLFCFGKYWTSATRKVQQI